MNSHWIPPRFRANFRPVKGAIRLALKPFKRRLVERAENPYATHIPILLGLPRLLKIRHLLELGCGEYSTLTFLNRSVFPDLEILTSFENDLAWKERIARLAGSDPRINLKLVVGTMSDAIFEADLQSFDLVFIDDSASGELRTETIREVIRKLGKSQVVVIHDYEYEPYRKAAKGASNHFQFDSLNPNTGIVWNDGPINKYQLRKLETAIKKNCNHIPPNDIQRWQQIFDREF